MSKRVLTVLLAVMMAVGIYTAVASAGVEGSFDLVTEMQPQWICTWNVPDVAAEAHAIKADIEGLVIPDKYLPTDWGDLPQKLLELADYTLPGDSAAIQAKVAEIKAILDELKKNLQDALDAIPSDICTEVTHSWVTDLETALAAIQAKFTTASTGLIALTDTFGPSNPIWADDLTALNAIDALPQTNGYKVADVSSTSTGDEYINPAEWTDVITEWTNFKAKAEDMYDEAVKMNKKFLLIDKTVQELDLAAIDCNDPDGHGITDVFTYITKLNGYLDDLNSELTEFIGKITWFTDDQYKHFLMKQVGLQSDETTPLYVYQLDTVNGVDLPGDWETKVGPTDGEIYDILTKAKDIQDEKDDIETGTAINPNLSTVKGKYADQTAIAGYIADLDPIYSNLEAISAKEYTRTCHRPTGQSAKFDFEYEAWLNLNITLSGLTISNELVMGMAGIEHYIADMSATLGALDLKDEFAFAVPYVGVYKKYWGWWYFFDYMTPGRGHTGGYVVGPLLFVKKRVNAEITIGGLTFKNLAMLEDVNFPNPRGATFNDVNGNGIYDSGDQVFGFGDIMTLKGTTVSGIAITSQTGLCADWGFYKLYPKHELLKIFEWDYNLIKKKRWLQTVEPECGWWAVPVEGGGYKPPLLFTKELIAIDGITLPAGITVSSVSVFSTVQYKLNGYPWNLPAYGSYLLAPTSGVAKIPFFTDIVFQMPLISNVDLLAEIYSTSPLSITLDKLVVSLVAGDLGFHWYDMNGDLTMDSSDAITVSGSVPLVGDLSLGVAAWLTPSVGFNVLEVDAVIPVSVGKLESLVTWEGFAHPGTLEFAYWSIKLTTDLATFKARFNPDGLYSASIDVGVSFSL